jgi:hypothetical protein
LINALPGKSSVNTVQHAIIEEAVFPVDPTDEPIDWLDSDHVICVYYSSISIPRQYKLQNSFRAVTSQVFYYYLDIGGGVHTGSTRHCGHSWPIRIELRVVVAAETREQASKPVLGRR